MGYKLAALALLAVLTVPGVAAESYGNELLDPVPNVTSIEIYNVSGASDRYQGGELEDSGLNKTFLLNQSEATEYRFTFEIVNDGGADWEIQPEDNLLHRGLNSSWSIERTWYNVSGNEYTGGTFSDGRLDWDTPDGALNTSETMWAKYIVQVDQNVSGTFNEYFEVNDTSTSAGSRDRHRLEITKYGDLLPEIIEPPNDTVVVQNQSFEVNGSVTCVRGRCGGVDLGARYNESSRADTLVPRSSSAEPFNTNTSNPGDCTSYLLKDETCYVSWDVNASGGLESYHLLDVNASSNVSMIQRNDSVDSLVQINTAVIIDLNWTAIEFGSLDPGSSQAAENNPEGYNVTVDEESSTVDNLWIRATDMVSQLFPDTYSIGAGNLSYSTERDRSAAENLSNTYQLLSSSLSSGEVLSTYYWIDVPNGIYEGGYNGTVYYKANSS